MEKAHLVASFNMLVVTQVTIKNFVPMFVSYGASKKTWGEKANEKLLQNLTKKVKK